MKLSLLAILMLSAMTTHATQYFVDSLGLDTQVGTKALPFATIARAQTAAVAGDTIYIRGGTYTYTTTTSTCALQTSVVSSIVLSKNGSAGKTIKYWAYPGETPIFDFYGVSADCRIKGFFVSGSYIHMKGLEIRGVPQNNSLNHENWGVWISGSYNTFELLNLHHNMGPGLFIQKGSNNLVLNCDSHHNYDQFTSNGAGESADGFGAHISAGDTGNVFRGCRAWWNTDDGFDLINAFAPVTIENCWAWYNGYLPGTFTTGSNGNGIKAGGYGTDTLTFPTSAVVHTVRFCLSFLNRSAGFYANHHPFTVNFYNNTGYGNHPNFNMLGMTIHGVDTTVGVYKNNLAYSGTNLTNYSFSHTEVTNSWNLTASVTISDADFGSVSLTGTDGPRQSDGSLPLLTYMHLVASSDAINKGTNLGFTYVGTAPDLGAFEYGTSSSNIMSSSSIALSSSSTVSSSSAIVASSSSTPVSTQWQNHPGHYTNPVPVYDLLGRVRIPYLL